MQIGVMGGTGPAGRGLAARLASVGHDVIVGSREVERSRQVVAELTDHWGALVSTARAGTNDDAAAASDVVVVATTWKGAVQTASQHADALDGRVVISMANGLDKVDRTFRVVLDDCRSIAEQIQAAVPGAKVVGAFQHVPALAFATLDRPLESDVVVVGDDEEARRLVLDLVAGIPDLRAFDGGPLANSLGVEAFAAVLLTANLRHRGSGTLRLLGLDHHAPTG